MPSRTILRNHIGWFASRAGLADEGLAERAGMSRAHLNRIKNGRVVPRVGTAIAVARALEVRVSQLYELQEQ